MLEHDYTVLETTSIKKLQQQVEDHLKNGWSLVGGISTFYDGLWHTYYIQAMVKREG